MKNFVMLLFIVSVFNGCKKDEEFRPLVDLTRDIPNEARWALVTPFLDSIDEQHIPYFNTNFPRESDYFSIFGLRTIDKGFTKYYRSRQSQDPNGPGFIYYTDTIEIQTWNNDSIICRSIEDKNKDTTIYSSYTFHGKYNYSTKNIEGYIDRLDLSYRCRTCPGIVYYYYSGKVPAMFIPINF
jgi:hypothetical protein